MICLSTLTSPKLRNFLIPNYGVLKYVQGHIKTSVSLSWLSSYKKNRLHILRSKKKHPPELNKPLFPLYSTGSPMFLSTFLSFFLSFIFSIPFFRPQPVVLLRLSPSRSLYPFTPITQLTKEKLGTALFSLLPALNSREIRKINTIGWGWYALS